MHRAPDLLHQAIDQDPYPLPTRSTRTSRNGLMANMFEISNAGSSQTMVCTCMYGVRVSLCVCVCVSVCVCVCVCVCDLVSSSDSLAGLSFLLESGS